MHFLSRKDSIRRRDLEEAQEIRWPEQANGIGTKYLSATSREKAALQSNGTQTMEWTHRNIRRGVDAGILDECSQGGFLAGCSVIVEKSMGVSSVSSSKPLHFFRDSRCQTHDQGFH